MSLRAKTVATAIGVLIVIVAIVCAVSEFLLMRSFVQLERQNAARNMQRVLLALEDKLAFLDSTVSDWAYWDDTYSFVQNRDQNYVRVNLTDSTLTTLGVNIVIFADRSGDIVFSRAFDLEMAGEMPVPPELYEHLKPTSPLLLYPAPQSGVVGILPLSDRVLLVASKPVLTSERKGPVQGTLIMGKFLDARELEGISDRVQVDLSMSSFDNAIMLSDFKEVLSHLVANDSISVAETNHLTVSAYTLLRDIYGQPALILKADMPREIYAYARVAVGSFLLYISAAGFVSTVIAFLFLDKVILSRLTALKNAAVRIGRNLLVSERLPVTGSDEISELADTINFMLARIEEGQTALINSETRYRTILEEMQEGYLELDPEGIITFCNSAVCQILGCSPSELVGTHFGTYIHPEDITVVYQTAKQICETGSPSSLPSCRFLRKHGILGYAEAHLYPKRGEDGNIDGFRVLARDITERKLLEHQMITASKLATTGELAAGIAHELNNPLTGVIGYAQLLLARPDLPPDIKSDLLKIQSEGQRAAKIVKDLLSFARQSQPKKILVDINRLVETTLELRSYELAAKGIEVEIRLNTELPRILADYNQIQQIVLNIVINAEQALSEANRHGKITIETDLKDGYVVIAISDNGPGIPENIRDKVFQPFFTTKEVGKGTGLGLSVCYGIVTAHGGKMYFQSRQGGGTTFFVELPAIDPVIVYSGQPVSDAID